MTRPRYPSPWRTIIRWGDRDKLYPPKAVIDRTGRWRYSVYVSVGEYGLFGPERHAWGWRMIEWRARRMLADYFAAREALDREREAAAVAPPE